MAQSTIKNVTGIVDKRDIQGQLGLSTAAAFLTNTSDVTSARARLTAISAATYPAATLDKMTLNDMLYAIRLNDEAASV
jgi:hypothetical protein